MDYITRKIIYIFGSIIGVVIVALGFASPEAMETHSETLMQIAGALMSSVLLLASKYTNKSYDKTRAAIDEATKLPELKYEDYAPTTVSDLIEETKAHLPKNYPY